MAQLGLTHRAAAIISGDDAPRAKPHPDTLLLAAQQANVAPSRCIYVGDDLRDIEAGHAAGMTTVGVRYGYLGETGDVASWGADHIVDHPVELIPLLDRN
jgi:phosphoglycolate phosphatase